MSVDAELSERASRVRLVVLDVDGVLTDGGLWYGAQGELQKRFDVKDGHGLVLLRHAGIPSAILTARRSEIVAVRAAELGIAHVLQGEKDKGRGLAKLLDATGLAPEQLAYMGDDVNDLPVLARVGLPCCPADAVDEVRAACRFVSRRPGGHGAVRELCERVLQAQGRWEGALAFAAGLRTEGDAGQSGA